MNRIAYALVMLLALLLVACDTGDGDEDAGPTATPEPRSFVAQVTLMDGTINNLLGNGFYGCTQASEVVNDVGRVDLRPAFYTLSNVRLSERENILIFRIPADITPGEYPILGVEEAEIGVDVAVRLLLSADEDAFGTRAEGTLNIISLADGPAQSIEGSFNFTIGRSTNENVTVEGAFGFLSAAGTDLYC